MKLSDYIVDFFEKQGLKHMFMVSGGGCMHLVNSFGNSSKIEYTCTQHEQSAAMAAEAYAKYVNDLGLVLVTSGPGVTNTITGLLGAYQDSIPCVFISGQAKRKQTVYNSNVKNLRQLGVQEVNVIPIVNSITKYAVMINEPEKIRYYLEKAVYLAKSGRPGPVWLDIPLDVQSAIIRENELIGYDPSKDKKNIIKNLPTDEEIETFLKDLGDSRRPVIIAGHGIRLADACKELKEFAVSYKIPVVTPIMGIDVLEYSHDNYIGKVGTKGTRAGNFAMQNADLIISIGSRLSVSVVGHEYDLFAREAKVVVIDIDENEHKKETIRIDRIIQADAKKFLQKILTVEEKVTEFNSWLNQCIEWKLKYPVCIPEYDNDENGINYYKFMDILADKMDSSTPFISDAGSAFYVAAQGSKVKEGQRFITSGAIATMGFGVPAAIGVAVANKSNSTVSITGDGSFQQNLQELSIVKYLNLPIKIFVMNNNGYLSIRQTQRKFFNGNLVGESPNSGVPMPNTKKVADAFELKYVLIDTIEKLENVLDDILMDTNPMVIEVKLLDNQEIIPTNAAKLNSDGTMVSKPLEDMYPFLEREEFIQNMVVKPLNE
jgi:acetolactate synthase-1/2/3 large subunit